MNSRVLTRFLKLIYIATFVWITLHEYGYLVPGPSFVGSGRAFPYNWLTGPFGNPTPAVYSRRRITANYGYGVAPGVPTGWETCYEY